MSHIAKPNRKINAYQHRCVNSMNNIGKQIYWLWLLIGLSNGMAQVPNDNIENRLELPLNQWHTSRTDDCTVQWGCVDKALTGKCIDYHNDQWFYFKSAPTGGTHYINIARQACRDVRGVQLVVMDGTPCQTNTYQILTCVSLANQDDVFAQLDSLRPNHTYLINVDGYLHDYCRFEIQVSGQSNGIPVNKKDMGTVKANMAGNVVKLDWTVDEEMAAQVNEFQVFRRHQQDVRSQQVVSLPLNRNAAGSYQDTYHAQDSVSKAGLYIYKIIGLTAEGNRIMVGEWQQMVTQKNVVNAYVTIPLKFQKNTSVTLLIYNAAAHSLAEKTGLTLRETNQTVRYYAGYLVQKGIRTLRIKAVDNKTGQTQEFSFDLNDPE